MYVCQFSKLYLKQITVIEHKINSITPYSTYVALIVIGNVYHSIGYFFNSVVMSLLCKWVQMVT